MSVVVDNFINGERCATEERLDIFEPATGLVYGQLARSGSREVEAAVEAARAALPAWKATSAEERSRLLCRVADLVEARMQEFAEAESRDNGKPVSLALAVDIPRVVSNFRFYAGAVLHEEGMSAHQPERRAMHYSVSQPVGVCALISPWNLPLYLLSWKIAPALACGNTAVCKPSEFTSVSASLLCDVFNDAGVPPGVLNVVFGLGAECGAPLVAHPLVPLVSFTGGTVTGTRIATAAAPFQKKVSLELGGKNANIVFADADLEEAVAVSVRSSFANQGEICLCGSRILVEHSVFDAFVEKFVAATKEWTVGDPTAASSRMGALVSKEHLEKVKFYVDLARQEGATVALGGTAPSSLPERCKDGYFFSPTILVGLENSARTCQEEIFGPVVTVVPFRDEAHAVALANDVKYGLSASVWTENVRRAQRMALALEAGLVWINCWLLRDLRVPFGGTKASGVGREGGKWALDFYQEQKSVTLKY